VIGYRVHGVFGSRYTVTLCSSAVDLLFFLEVLMAMTIMSSVCNVWTILGLELETWASCPCFLETPPLCPLLQCMKDMAVI